MRGQVPRRGDQDVRGGRRLAQVGKQAKGALDRLDRVEVAVLPKEQASERCEEPRRVARAVKVSGDVRRGLVHLLLAVQEGGELPEDPRGVVRGTGLREPVERVPDRVRP